MIPFTDIASMTARIVAESSSNHNGDQRFGYDSIQFDKVSHMCGVTCTVRAWGDTLRSRLTRKSKHVKFVQKLVYRMSQHVVDIQRAVYRRCLQTDVMSGVFVLLRSCIVFVISYYINEQY